MSFNFAGIEKVTNGDTFYYNQTSDSTNGLEIITVPASSDSRIQFYPSKFVPADQIVWAPQIIEAGWVNPVQQDWVYVEPPVYQPSQEQWDELIKMLKKMGFADGKWDMRPYHEKQRDASMRRQMGQQTEFLFVEEMGV